MRPTDENQPASMRPNLMSPRRTSGEDSILAMLERDPMRRHGSKAGNGRLAWYGAGGAVALALTTTLVWLAAGNNGHKPGMEDALMAGAAQPAQHGTTPALPAPEVRQVALAASPETPALQPASPAVIVDQAPPNDDVPPLRLLKPAPAQAPTVAPQRAPATGLAKAPTPATAAAPARPPARTAVPPARPGVSPPRETRPELRREARQALRPAAPVPARARPVVVARNAVKPAPGKPPRAVNPAKPADAHVDADVALISAVIVHANGHAPQGSQMTELLCPNDACKEKPARP